MGKKVSIESYNKLGLEAFKRQFLQDITLSYASELDEFRITLETAATVNERDFEACFNLIAYTSKSDYEQSTTHWRPKVKKIEMNHVDMRYLLVRSQTGEEVLGFASFMLTYEVGKEVVYLYEIHLSDVLRGKGLGRYLIDIVSRIGKNAGVEKIVLTVFTRNSKAIEWYNHLGFAVDEFWPKPRTLRGGVVKQADYRILSRPIA